MSFSLSIMFCFGFFVGSYLFFQICTGLVLCCWFGSSFSEIFDTIQFASRNVSFIWLVSYGHMNIVSLVFLVLYFHMFNSVVTYTHKWYVLLSGVFILFLFFLSGFIGYSLVLSQMSYWAIIVITNLVTILPYVGFDLLLYIWGDCSIGTVVINSFLVLHFITPLVLLVLVFVHLYMVHSGLSSEWLVVVNHRVELISFWHMYLLKDFFFFVSMSLVGVLLVLGYSTWLVHPDSYSYASVLSTPVLIEPEWYFLLYYAVLRSIPNKFIGLLCFLYSLVGLLNGFASLWCLGSLRSSVLVTSVICLVCSLIEVGLLHTVWPVLDVALTISILWLVWLCW